MNNTEHQETLTNPDQQSMDELVFPEALIDRTGLGEYGAVIFIAQRARKLSLGSHATLKVPYNTKEPVLALLEVSQGTVTLDQLRQDYVASATDSFVSHSLMGSIRNEDDLYAQYMQINNAEDNIDEERLMALHNLND